MAVTNIPSNKLSGRCMLYTDLGDNFTVAELKADLERIIPQHTYNREQIRYLQEYHRGYHPAIENRQKITRTDIDNRISVNYPTSFTRDIVGYFLGKPIELTHRKGKFHGQMETLRQALIAENKPQVDYEIAADASICGIGYSGTFAEKNPLNGTHLKYIRLDPLNTAVVYSTDPTKGPVYAFTSFESAPSSPLSGSAKTVTTTYRVYSHSDCYTFVDETSNGSDATNGAGLVFKSKTAFNLGPALPIQAHRNNLWLLGDWEVAIAIMDALDGVVSDGVNDIQQTVNSILVAIGCELTDEVYEKLDAHGMLNIQNVNSSPGSVQPTIDFIGRPMDSTIGIAMRDYLEATLRIIVGVPDRKTRGGGGGDTGDAVFMRDGWQDIDLVATAKEPYFIEGERESLANILYILETYNEKTGSIKAEDIEIHFNRNKTVNLQTKAQVFQILTNTGLDPADALDISDLTTNVTDVIMRMRENSTKPHVIGELGTVSNGTGTNSDVGTQAVDTSSDANVVE